MKLNESIADLVTANHILAYEGVVDAFGHVSVRHPLNPESFLLSRSCAPELVQSEDILEFHLDGTPVDLKGLSPYAERFIHGAAYEKNPNIHAVIHNHAEDLIPFSITEAKLGACCHVASSIGKEVRTWDINDHFGDTNLLVLNIEQGRDLANFMGNENIALMRGHGCIVTGADLKETVRTAIYLLVNARILTKAMQMGEPKFLTDGEIERATSRKQGSIGGERAWEYWKKRSGL